MYRLATVETFFWSEVPFVAGAESIFFRCHIQMQWWTRLPFALQQPQVQHVIAAGTS